MKIGSRLFLGFGVTILILIAIGGSGYWGASSITNETMRLLHSDVAINGSAMDLTIGILNMRRFEKDLFLNIGNAEKEAEYTKKWDEALNDTNKTVEIMEKLLFAESDKDMLKEMKAELPVYAAKMKKIMSK